MSKKSFFLGLIIGVLVGGLIGYIEAGVGQTINLKTMAVVVNKSGEQTTLSARYGQPAMAARKRPRTGQNLYRLI